MKYHSGQLSLIIIIGLLVAAITAAVTWFLYSQSAKITAEKEKLSNQGSRVQSQEEMPGISGLKIFPIKEERGEWQIISGTVTVSAESKDAQKVEFYYLAFNASENEKKLIGSDSNSSDSWSAVWNIKEKGQFFVWAQAIGQDKKMTKSYKIKVEVE